MSAITDPDSEDTRLPIGIDLVSWIGQTIQELAGFDTLAYELIQNADDSPASRLVFDITDDALLVWNDGVFSNCGQQEERVCPLVAAGDPSCDLHRFRSVASGNKRAQRDTTGAFGIGFTSVYAITDRPELHTAGFHWIIDPAEADVRVRSRADPEEHTRFELPWACDPSAPLARYRTLVETTDLELIVSTFCNVIPFAMPFLRHLERIEIKHNGARRGAFQRTPEPGMVSVNGSATPISWRLLHGDFKEDAARLRSESSIIEPSRRSTVTVAIATSEQRDGKYYATLPTRHEIPLPFCVNADFYPKQDRKRLLLDSEPYAGWNRAAIRAASFAFAAGLEEVRGILGATALWEAILRAKRLADGASKANGNPEDAYYWNALRESITATPIAWTSRAEWRLTNEVVLVPEAREAWADLLEDLGIATAHPEVARVCRQLPDLAGTEDLRLRHVLPALSPSVGAPTSRALTGILDDPERRHALWRLLDDLHQRAAKQDLAALTDQLRACALAPAIGGEVQSPKDLWRANKRTTGLFGPIVKRRGFLDADAVPDGVSLFERLVPPFETAHAIEALEHAPALEDKDTALQLLRWFKERSDEITGDQALAHRLAALPVFPSSTGLAALPGLHLPGGFDDPLGLTDVLALDGDAGLTSFLEQLGASVLTFSEYVENSIPRALRTQTPGSKELGALVRLLALRVGELRDNPNAQRKLHDLPIVECIDGQFRPPLAVYFDSKPVRLVLGDAAALARLPDKTKESTRDLYEWLGVVAEPRADDLVAHVRRIATGSPNGQRKQDLQVVLEELERRHTAGDAATSEVFDALSGEDWLPAKNDTARWYKPTELYDCFNEGLFASQAKFLDLSRATQQRVLRALRRLGVGDTPTTEQVVAHVAEWSRKGRTDLDTRAVYQFLNPRAHDPATAQLRSIPSLLIDKRWLRPDEVYWRDPGLGRFSTQLSLHFHLHKTLLDALGVKEDAGTQDALRVLAALEDAHRNTDEPLTEEDHAVALRCWGILGSALEQLEPSVEEHLATLRDRRVAPDRHRVLRPPRTLFFESWPGLGAKFGGQIASHIIERQQGATNALAGAGARDLFEALEVDLLECAGRRLSQAIADHVQSMRQPIARVLGSDAPYSARGAEQLLARVRFVEGETLLVRYKVRSEGTTHETEAFESTAEYLSNEDAIYVLIDGDEVPWAAIAQVLARTINPGSGHGSLAMSLKAVLEAPSPESAEQELDAFHFPRLSAAPIAIAATQAVDDWDSSERGQSDGADHPVPPPATSREISKETVEAEPVAPPTSVPMREDEREADQSPARNRPDLSLAEAEPVGVSTPAASENPSHQSGSETSEPNAVGSSPGQAAPPRQRSRTRRGRLRSYVEQPIESSRLTEESVEAEERRLRDSRTDRAGVARVLRDENADGRAPREMPHDNPGYDVEAREPDGAIRYIEVKSTAGPWGETGVALTRTQYQMARELGSAYWLYVVENAGGHGEAVHRIQDPAARVDQYFFDDGWRDAST